MAGRYETRYVPTYPQHSLGKDRGRGSQLQNRARATAGQAPASQSELRLHPSTISPDLECRQLNPGAGQVHSGPRQVELAQSGVALAPGTGW